MDRFFTADEFCLIARYKFAGEVFLSVTARNLVSTEGLRNLLKAGMCPATLLTKVEHASPTHQRRPPEREGH